MARSHRPKKQAFRPPNEDDDALKTNDERLRDAQAKAAAGAPARNNGGTLAEMNAVVMPEPSLADKSLAVPLFIELVLFVALLVLGYAIYSDFTSVP